jgi:GT2 family glycosyltransferase
MPKVLAPPPVAELEPGAAPSFTVAIPAFQAATTIGEAVSSVLAQTAPALEIIVCDDGSSDDLEAALAPYGDAVQLIRTEHRGVAAARNELLRAAQGEFVVPLDADDVYAPTRLQRLAELAGERPDLDILSTDASFLSEGRPAGRFNERTPFAAHSQQEAILDRCFVICPAIRRTRLLEIGGYDERLRTAEDWDVCIRLILSGSVAGSVEEPLLEYRLGGSSLTAGRAETLRERVFVLEKAAATEGLAPSVRRAAVRALSHHRSRALQQAAREAVGERRPEARARLLAVARSRDVGPRARAAALLALLTPRRARVVVERVLSGSTGRPPG